MKHNISYVYIHIRLDSNQVFYVGIGKSKNYKRAYSTYDRSKHWKNIVNKHGYVVHIVKDKLNWDDACKLEIELIQKYGRKDLGEGVLINLTDGGQGPTGVKRTKETIERIKKASMGKFTIDWFIEKYGYDDGVNKYKERSKQISENFKKVGGPWNKGKKLYHLSGKNYPNPNRIKWATGKKLGPRTDGVKSKIRKKLGTAKVVFQYSLEGEFIKRWESIRLASSALNIRHDCITGCCRGEYGFRTAGGYLWSFDDNSNNITPMLTHPNGKKILQFDKDGNFIKEWNSHMEASIGTGISRSSITRCCNGVRKNAGGYIWKSVKNSE